MEPETPPMASIGVLGPVEQFAALKTASEVVVLRTLHATAEELAWLKHKSEQPGATGAPHDWWVRRAHQSLEDVRVLRHPEWSARVHDNTEGVTTDVLCFSVEALAVAVRRIYGKRGGELPVILTPDVAVSHWLFKTNSKPVAEWTPVELSAGLAAVFCYGRWVDWLDKGFRDYVALLQWHCLQWTADHLAGIAWPGVDAATTRHHVVLWACATARVKRGALQHAYAAKVARVPAAAIVAIVDDEFEGLIDPTDWLRRTVKTWSGPRLREAVGRAAKRRDLRPGEAGRVTAFAGNNNLQRARGSLDVIETTLHEIDYEQLLDMPISQCSPTILTIREILVLRLVHNTMEAIGLDDFMGTCCLLNSMRSALNPHRNTGGAILVELRGGWLVTPAAGRCVAGTDSLEVALAVWYHTKFGGNDPFGMRKV